MKSKDLRVGQLVAMGAKSVLKSGVLSQAMVVGIGFDIEYFNGGATLKVDPKRVLLVAPLKDQGYPNLLLNMIRESDDLFVTATKILELIPELKRLSFLVTSVPLSRIQMPWETWMKERTHVLKQRKEELKEDIKAEEDNKKRYDAVKDQFRSFEMDLDTQKSCPNRFMVSLTLEQAEEIIYTINKLKQRVTLN